MVENPNLPVSGGANNWTIATGNLGELEAAYTLPYPALPDGGAAGSFFALTVHNDTCATYWARIVLHMDPIAPTVADADTDADAGAGDAALD